MVNFAGAIRYCKAYLRSRNYEVLGHPYHAWKHADMVSTCVATLAQMAGLQEDWIADLYLAGWGHDIEQDLGPGENEIQSGILMAGIMERFGYPHYRIARVSNGIYGTTVSWENGVMVQYAEMMDKTVWPLADADLCSLGANQVDFMDMSIRLMAEFAKKRVEELTVDEIRNGWIGQYNFMKDRRFLTAEAEELMRPNMNINIQLAKRMAGM